jgi:O-antigen/teichoic acid export membrane protein
MSTFFNSGHAVVRQAKFYSIAAISSLVLKLFLVHAWGIGGVIWATVIGFGVFYIVPAWITSRRILELPVSATA